MAQFSGGIVGAYGLSVGDAATALEYGPSTRPLDAEGNRHRGGIVGVVVSMSLPGWRDGALDPAGAGLVVALNT